MYLNDMVGLRDIMANSENGNAGWMFDENKQTKTFIHSFGLLFENIEYTHGFI